MSLATDSIFVAALRSNSELLDILCTSQQSGREVSDPTPRLYGTSIGMPDEDADNVPVPYCIVTFDGLTNNKGTKDDLYEGPEDSVQIGIEMTARTLDQLHELTDMVRTTIHDYLCQNDTPILDYTFSADKIQYDSLKPCYWQVLMYDCSVANTPEDYE